MTRRRWVSEQAYADLVALCQFLPGPASSQVGMAIGLHRAGYAGLAAAWMAFTLPSAVLLVGFAYGADALGADADADRQRATIAVLGMIVTLLAASAFGQVLAIVLGALVGLAWATESRRGR